MKTQVEFRSNKFPPYSNEEEELDPGVWGKRLAEYLGLKLSELGVDAEDIVPEDWGWYVPIKIDGFTLALCCGHQQGDNDQFLCFTDPKVPVIRKFFKKIDITPQLSRLVSALEKILASDPDIRDVTWMAPD